MAKKGDKALLEPLARKLYADGNSLTAIAEQLGVSATSLKRWKDETLVPGNDLDEWDRARQQKRGNLQRMRDLFERELEHIENLEPGEVTPPMMDTLSKLGALIEKWDKIEKAQRAADDVVKEVKKKAGIDAETEDLIRAKILGITQ